jgi:hypothetical protein
MVKRIGVIQINENTVKTPIATRWPVLLLSPVTI